MKRERGLWHEGCFIRFVRMPGKASGSVTKFWGEQDPRCLLGLTARVDSFVEQNARGLTSLAHQDR